MSLYLKYRPLDLDSMVGNEATINSLRSLLEKSPEDRPRSLLFTGPSGCGKTTLARIIAGAYGVHEHDLREVDTADYRGIDSVRSIRQQMHARPMAGDSRAWILDEVHQTTKEAQSALLKALEDTPAHVLFILATTDPQKLLPTIRNRCVQYEVRSLEEDEINELLKTIVRSERKRVSRDALKVIARDSQGSPRLALTTLDKMIDLPKEQQVEAAERTAAEENEVVALCRALLKGDNWTAIARILKGLQKQDPEKVRRGVLGYMQSVLLGGRTNTRAVSALEAFAPNTYDIGWPGITLAAYTTMEG